MSDSERGTDRAGRRAKRFLTPMQKYEIYLQLLRGRSRWRRPPRRRVDRSTVVRIRHVAKEGALAALAESRPGVKAGGPGARGGPGESVARLSARLKEMAVKLMLVEGKGGWDEWPRPPPGRRGHQGRSP